MEVIIALSNQEEVIWPGHSAPLDISPRVKQQHPHIRFTVEGEVKPRHPVRIL